MTEIEKCIELKNRGYTYDPITGVVRNKDGKNNISQNKYGYKRLAFKKDCKTYTQMEHRFIWYMLYETLPQNQLDHINGDKLDNRIINLREVSNQQNSFNRKSKGYSFDKLTKKYKAYICKDYKYIHLGFFETKEEAHASYLAAKKVYHII